MCNNKTNQKIALPSQLPPITPDTVLTPSLLQTLFPDLSEYPLNYDTQMHSYYNKLVEIPDTQPSAAVYCADSYFGGTCNPDFTYQPEYLQTHTLCPYGLPERRDIDPVTGLPVNFDSHHEVYILNATFSFKVKPYRIPSFTKSRMFYPVNYKYEDTDKSTLFHPASWCMFEDMVDRDSNTFTITQPQWEGIKERYHISNLTYNYALVFKASPFLFKLLIPYFYAQNDRSLFTNVVDSSKSINTQYPAVKAFYSAYHRELFLKYLEIYLNRNRHISVYDLFPNPRKRSSVEIGDLLYTPYNTFAITLDRETLILEPDTLYYIKQYNEIAYPMMYYFYKTTSYMNGEILIPKQLLGPSLLRIQKNLLSNYSSMKDKLGIHN